MKCDICDSELIECELGCPYFCPKCKDHQMYATEEKESSSI